MIAPIYGQDYEHVAADRVSIKQGDEDEFDSIPEAMRNAHRWLLHRKKIPYYVNGIKRQGELDSPEDCANLASFEVALRTYRSGGYCGLGFALGPDGTGNYWQGIDLDHIADHHSLQLIADEMPSYTETSLSGKGKHAIGYGRRFAALGSNGSGIEAYSEKRYFTVTGDSTGIQFPVCIADFVERRLRPLHQRASDHNSANGSTSVESVTPQTYTHLRSALFSMRSDDRDLWVGMGFALKVLGDVGRGLWLEWSATSEKYNPSDDARTWNSFKPTRTGYQAVFAEAQRRGWINPMSSAAHSETSDEGKEYRSNVVSYKDFSTETDPPFYVWQRVLEKGKLYSLTSRWGHGKTALMINVAMSLAAGRDIGGIRTVQCKVLFLCGENPDDVKLRVRAAAEVMKISAMDLEGNIYFTRRPFAIDDPEQLQMFIRDAKAHGPYGAMIIDTGPAHSCAEEENDNPTMHKFAMSMRDLMEPIGNPATIALMHPTKGATKDNLHPRGGGAFSGSIDGELCAWSDGNGLVEFWHTEKFRGPGFEPLIFQLDRHEFPDIKDNFGAPAIAVIASHVPSTEAKSSRRLDERWKSELTTLAEAAFEAESDDVHVEVWRSLFYAKSTADSLDGKRQAFGRIRKKLSENQLVTVKDDVYSSTHPTFVTHLSLLRFARSASQVAQHSEPPMRDTVTHA